MRSDDFTHEQVAWLNTEAGDRARSIRLTLEKLEARGVEKGDPIYRALFSELSTAMRTCEMIHKLLNKWRDVLRENSRKQTSGNRTRITLRDRRELGH